MADGKPNKSDKVTIKIPRRLYDKIALVIEGTGYNSVTDFIVYVLRDLVATHEISAETELNAHDMEKVKQRLKSLGYI